MFAFFALEENNEQTIGALNMSDKLLVSAFHSVSARTAGMFTVDMNAMTDATKLVMIFLMFIGGCSGSTAGGIKVIRWVILSKQLKNEVGKMIHPHGIFSIRVDNRAGRKDIVFSVAAFIFLYFMLVVVTAFVATSDNAIIPL